MSAVWLPSRTNSSSAIWLSNLPIYLLFLFWPPLSMWSSQAKDQIAYAAAVVTYTAAAATPGPLPTVPSRGSNLQRHHRSCCAAAGTPLSPILIKSWCHQIHQTNTGQKTLPLIRQHSRCLKRVSIYADPLCPVCREKSASEVSVPSTAGWCFP